MFDVIFASFGPLGSALALFAMLLPALLIAGRETARLARPEIAQGMGRLRAALVPPWIAPGSEEGDSPERHASRGSRLARLVSALHHRLGAGAATERATGRPAASASASRREEARR